eukprot:TRINITY_DN3742_c1_g1_i3.p1 TRINITY_DN3742_c1_g1~~TRINITY_DN3742_c1_g1_i3.p1  ORF type:complete len:109 (-),score=6.07 TRINITY_DN3742_c1_g1_i3:380-676(-)
MTGAHVVDDVASSVSRAASTNNSRLSAGEMSCRTRPRTTPDAQQPPTRPAGPVRRGHRITATSGCSESRPESQSHAPSYTHSALHFVQVRLAMPRHQL